MNDFTIVLTSSVLAAGLTSTINWLLQRNNFQNDYFKKIIDKRMATYDAVYQILSRLQSIEIYSDGRKMHGTFTEFEYYQDFVVQLTKESLPGLWLSSQFSLKLTNFSVFLYNKFGFADDGNTISSEKIRKIAVDNYDEICRIKDDLRDQLLHDLKTLHEVPTFLSRKK